MGSQEAERVSKGRFGQPAMPGPVVPTRNTGEGSRESLVVAVNLQ